MSRSPGSSPAQTARPRIQFDIEAVRSAPGATVDLQSADRDIIDPIDPMPLITAKDTTGLVCALAAAPLDAYAIQRDSPNPREAHRVLLILAGRIRFSMHASSHPPASEPILICFGDSITTNGTWVASPKAAAGTSPTRSPSLRGQPTVPRPRCSAKRRPAESSSGKQRVCASIVSNSPAACRMQDPTLRCMMSTPALERLVSTVHSPLT